MTLVLAVVGTVTGCLSLMLLAVTTWLNLASFTIQCKQGADSNGRNFAIATVSNGSRALTIRAINFHTQAGSIIGAGGVNHRLDIGEVTEVQATLPEGQILTRALIVDGRGRGHTVDLNKEKRVTVWR